MNLFQEQPVKNSNFGSISFRRWNSAYCPLCEKLVTLTTLADSAIFFQSDVEEIEQLAECGELHRIHNRAGKVMICGESLIRCFEGRPTEPLNLEIIPRLDGPEHSQSEKSK